MGNFAWRNATCIFADNIDCVIYFILICVVIFNVVTTFPVIICILWNIFILLSYLKKVILMIYSLSGMKINTISNSPILFLIKVFYFAGTIYEYTWWNISSLSKWWEQTYLHQATIWGWSTFYDHSSAIHRKR